MTKAEYLERLSYKLRALPEAEKQDALDYYDGYLSDAENEAAAIEELGAPGIVAANILVNYIEKAPEPQAAPTARGMKTAWAIILAIFALPVGLPIIIALGAVAFSLFIALAAVVFSLGVTALALVAGGLVGLVTFPFVIFQDFGAAMMSGGMGIAAVGAGLLFVSLMRKTLLGFPRLSRFVAAKIKRRTGNGRQKSV